MVNAGEYEQMRDEMLRQRARAWRAEAALKAVWDDMRAVDKHFVNNEVLAKVRAVIGDELDMHDPASSSKA
jgi:microcystin degradation protein MlrC